MEKININDLGTSLQITVTENDSVVDISAATGVAVILTKPDGTDAEKTGTFLTDGTDGVIEYSTLAGDVDQSGIWSMIGKVTFSATQVYRTIDPDQFEVVN